MREPSASSVTYPFRARIAPGSTPRPPRSPARPRAPSSFPRRRESIPSARPTTHHPPRRSSVPLTSPNESATILHRKGSREGVGPSVELRSGAGLELSNLGALLRERQSRMAFSPIPGGTRNTVCRRKPGAEKIRQVSGLCKGWWMTWRKGTAVTPPFWDTGGDAWRGWRRPTLRRATARIVEFCPGALSNPSLVVYGAHAVQLGIASGPSDKQRRQTRRSLRTNQQLIGTRLQEPGHTPCPAAASSSAAQYHEHRPISKDRGIDGGRARRGAGAGPGGAFGG